MWLCAHLVGGATCSVTASTSKCYIPRHVLCMYVSPLVVQHLSTQDLLPIKQYSLHAGTDQDLSIIIQTSVPFTHNGLYTLWLSAPLMLRVPAYVIIYIHMKCGFAQSPCNSMSCRTPHEYTCQIHWKLPLIA